MDVAREGDVVPAFDGQICAKVHRLSSGSKSTTDAPLSSCCRHGSGLVVVQLLGPGLPLFCSSLHRRQSLSGSPSFFWGYYFTVAVIRTSPWALAAPCRLLLLQPDTCGVVCVSSPSCIFCVLPGTVVAPRNGASGANGARSKSGASAGTRRPGGSSAQASPKQQDRGEHKRKTSTEDILGLGGSPAAPAASGGVGAAGPGGGQNGGTGAAARNGAAPAPAAPGTPDLFDTGGGGEDLFSVGGGTGRQSSAASDLDSINFGATNSGGSGGGGQQAPLNPRMATPMAPMAPMNVGRMGSGASSGGAGSPPHGRPAAQSMSAMGGGGMGGGGVGGVGMGGGPGIMGGGRQRHATLGGGQSPVRGGKASPTGGTAVGRPASKTVASVEDLASSTGFSM